MKWIVCPEIPGRRKISHQSTNSNGIDWRESWSRHRIMRISWRDAEIALINATHGFAWEFLLITVEVDIIVEVNPRRMKPNIHFESMEKEMSKHQPKQNKHLGHKIDQFDLFLEKMCCWGISRWIHSIQEEHWDMTDLHEKCSTSEKILSDWLSPMRSLWKEFESKAKIGQHLSKVLCLVLFFAHWSLLFFSSTRSMIKYSFVFILWTFQRIRHSMMKKKKTNRWPWQDQIYSIDSNWEKWKEWMTHSKRNAFSYFNPFCFECRKIIFLFSCWIGFPDISRWVGVSVCGWVGVSVCGWVGVCVSNEIEDILTPTHPDSDLLLLWKMISTIYWTNALIFIRFWDDDCNYGRKLAEPPYGDTLYLVMLEWRWSFSQSYARCSFEVQTKEQGRW